MKTKLMLLSALAVLGLAACEKEQENLDTVPASGTLTFTAGFDTKTAVNFNSEGNTYAITWEAGDKVSLFDGTSNSAFTAGKAGASTTLSGTAASASTYYALYPYSATASLSGAVISTEIPASVKAAADGAAGFANLSVAKTSGTSLQFATVAGVLKFTLGSDLNNVTEVKISAPGEENLCGSVTIDLSTATPTLAVAEGAKVISVVPATGETFAGGHSYYVSALPGTLSAGISLEFVTASGNIIKSKDKALTIKAGVVTNLGTIGSLAAPLTSPYEVWFAEGDFGVTTDENYNNPLQDTLDGAKWTLDIISTAGGDKMFQWTGSEGWTRNSIQVGYRNAGVPREVHLSCKDFPGEITKLELYYITADDRNDVVASAKVGGHAFGTEVAHVNEAWKAEFTGSASGEIVFIIKTTTCDFPVFLKGVRVEFDPNGTPAEPIDPGAEGEYAYTFKENDFGIYAANNDGVYFGTASATLDGISWTVNIESNNGGDKYYTWGATGWNSGIQVGYNGGGAPKEFTLSTTGFTGTITEATLYYVTYDDVEVTASATVGGVAFGTAVPHVNEAYEAVFTGSASGELVFRLSQPETNKMAMFLKGVDVKYTGAGSSSDPS